MNTRETNVWDAVKTVAICICAYFLAAMLTATNFDHTEVQTGGLTTLMAATGVMLAKKQGLL